MKLPENCNIQSCASQDSTRYVLCGVFIERTNGLAVATNGRVMGVAAIDDEETPMLGADTVETAIVPTEVVKAAQAAPKKRRLIAGYIRLAENEISVPVELQKHTTWHTNNGPEPEKFPKWRKVVPDHKKLTYRVAVAVKHLLEAASAVGGDTICLSFDPTCQPSPEDVGSHSGPIVVTGKSSDRFAVLMPVRAEWCHLDSNEAMRRSRSTSHPEFPKPEPAAPAPQPESTTTTPAATE